MNFWIFVGALILNILIGRWFKPYTGWIVKLNARMFNLFGKLKNKTSKRWGTALTILTVIIVWAGIDMLIMLGQTQSDIYGYAAYGVATFFFVQCGQLSGVLAKFRGNTQNDVFVKQLFGYLQVKNIDRTENSSYCKNFIHAYTDILARRVVTPLIFLVSFGVGATAAYMIIDTLAASDNDESVKSHTFAETAIKISAIVAYVGYGVLFILLKALCWITGNNKKHEKMNIASKCRCLIQDISQEHVFCDGMVARCNTVIYIILVMNAILIIAVYVFIQAALAAAGLDEYWDFWSGKNLNKE